VLSYQLLPGKGKAKPETIHLFGGRLCLDFANSVDWSADGEPLGPETDALLEPGELAHWGRRVGVLDGEPPIPPGELAAARTLRLALYDIFAAVGDGRAPAKDALARLAGDHAQAAAAAHLAERGGAWQLDWDPADPRRVRFAVAADAVALLADPDRLARVRRCPGRGCGWLFLDASGRRRWCSMQTCGSREKMRRLYERRRTTAG
jgi:predicted RNA-binding Zn ribbon-like protein